MASQEQPLDEIMWSSPYDLAEFQGLHSNTILLYFSRSPFFDRTSNNAVLWSQAIYNQQLVHLIATREAMEAHLRSMSGLEFVVAQEPAEMAPGTGTGVWVIRKQTRRKRPGQEDEVTVHSTYFVMGDRVFMAPTVADVLGSRMLTAMSSLQKVISTAATLPDFSPALGHTYLPPTAAKPKNLDTNSQSALPSKEATPVPGFDSSKAPTSTSNNNSSDLLSQRLLEESLNVYMQYGHEYMDSNPITGEPGAFILASTGRKDVSKLTVPAAVAAKGPLQAPSKAPPALKTDLPPSGAIGSPRKGDKSPKTPGGIGKIKRKKSKVGTGQTPKAS